MPRFFVNGAQPEDHEQEFRVVSATENSATLAYGLNGEPFEFRCYLSPKQWDEAILLEVRELGMKQVHHFAPRHQLLVAMHYLRDPLSGIWEFHQATFIDHERRYSGQVIAPAFGGRPDRFGFSIHRAYTDPQPFIQYTECPPARLVGRVPPPPEPQRIESRGELNRCVTDYIRLDSRPIPETVTRAVDPQDLRDRQQADRQEWIDKSKDGNAAEAIGLLLSGLEEEVEQDLLSLEANPLWEELKAKAAQLQSEIETIQAAADANMGLVDCRQFELLGGQ